jgi:hypothetical protein
LSHRDKGIEVYPAAAIADSGDSVRATTKQKGHSSQSGFCFVPNIFKLINGLTLRGRPKQNGYSDLSGLFYSAVVKSCVAFRFVVVLKVQFLPEVNKKPMPQFRSEGLRLYYFIKTI